MTAAIAAFTSTISAIPTISAVASPIPSIPPTVPALASTISTLATAISARPAGTCHTGGHHAEAERAEHREPNAASHYGTSATASATTSHANAQVEEGARSKRQGANDAWPLAPGR